MKKQSKEYYLYRLLEIFPGFMVWLTIIGIVVLSFISPISGIYFAIAFDLYWILKVFYLFIFLFISWFKYRKTIKIDWWTKLRKEYLEWKEYKHIIFLPTAGEPWEIVNNTFLKLKNTNYDHKKMIVVLAGEENFVKEFKEISEKIKKKYNNVFYKIITTVHPANLEGEIPGKGSNLYHAGHEIKKYVDENINF